MRTFTKAGLREFWIKNARAKEPRNVWYRLTSTAVWTCFADVRSAFASADQVGDQVIFNIGGNNYRLIVRINYRHAGVQVKWVGTHAEYNALSPKDIESL